MLCRFCCSSLPFGVRVRKIDITSIITLFFSYPSSSHLVIYGLIFILSVSGLIENLNVPDSASPFLVCRTNVELLFLQCLPESFYTKMNRNLGSKQPFPLLQEVLRKDIEHIFQFWFLSIKNFCVIITKDSENNTGCNNLLH